MERDIDQIIHAVKQKIPDVEIVQSRKSHPADDDGIWWFKRPELETDIQIESTYGSCPFIVETNELCCEKARKAETVAEAVTMIVEYLDAQRKVSQRPGRV